MLLALPLELHFFHQPLELQRPALFTFSIDEDSRYPKLLFYVLIKLDTINQWPRKQVPVDTILLMTTDFLYA